MVYAPVRSIIPSLKLGDYLSVQAHKPCSISHLMWAPLSRSHLCKAATSLGEGGRILNTNGYLETK